MKRLAYILTAASALSLPLVGVGPAAFAATAGPAPTVVHCGDTITTDTTLAKDVGPCPSTAIILGASNITLDLNGHTVFGTPAPGEGPGIAGSAVNGDTVKNGTVTLFDTGVYFEFGTGETVTNLNVHDNIGSLDGNGIFGEGVQLFQTNNSTISNNVVVHNGTFAGIDVFDSSGTTITGNAVSRNNIQQVGSGHGGNIQQDIGIWVVFLAIPTSNNVVRGNAVQDNGLDGIQISRFATNNTVTRNAVLRNGFGQVQGIRDGDGVAIFGSSTLVQGNSSTSNAANGIYVRSGATTNRILGNATAGNGTGRNSAGTGFDLKDGNLTPPCDANVWSGNAFVTFNQVCVTR